MPILPALFFAGVIWLGSGVSSAAAQETQYKVTFVARVCPAYTDIFANRARNDIQETLADLGPDSPYVEPFRVSPSVEDGESPQTTCHPLPNWQFTLGHSYESRAVTGPWGSLSKVTDPFPRAPIVTQNSTPLLDQNGQQIGHDTIAGAVTITLSSDEVAQAESSQQLWAQGGTPDDPVLNNQYPGQYGFGALRCAVDALNGDNVEYIFFPEGVTHVFCYGLYVEPPPTSGTITIKKQVIGAPEGDNPSFPFSGSVSFDPNGFTLGNGDSRDFYRAGGQTWGVTEGDVPNYRLQGIACTTEPTPSESTYTTSGATLSIALVADEHVTCVYTNEYVPPSGGLTIRKVTIGRVGTFSYSVISQFGERPGSRVVATTTTPGVPVDAVPSLLNLAPGTYVIRERVPRSLHGRWHLVRVRCNSRSRSTTRPFLVEIRSGVSVVCTFVNRFIPRGSISIAKVTEGGTGTATFKISPTGGPAADYLQTATTTSPGVAADAAPKTPADATDHLRLGRYVITEQPPLTASGEWTLTSVVCDGVDVPFAQGAVEVTLTRTNPDVRCVFTDSFSATPTPPPQPNPEPLPPPPGPGPQPPTPAPDYQISDLSVTKVAAAPGVTRGAGATFHLTVKNLGPDAAEDVVLADQPRGTATVVSIHPSSGSCRKGPPIICRLGTLKSGAAVTITVRMRVRTAASTFTNRAVVGTATVERTLANNIAAARIDVLSAPPPRVTG